MPETPKPTLNAYAVSINFAPPQGMICVNGVVAPNPESAVAMVMHRIMSDLPVEARAELTGIAATVLTLEWLRFAVKAVETGKGDGTVLSLVQPAQKATDPDELARARSEAILSGRVECVSAETFPQDKWAGPWPEDPAA